MSHLNTRAGIITIAGRPNAGKSTLLNRVIGERLAITSAKPQSTRERVVGLRTDAATQMVLFDTPGLLDPSSALQESMRRSALRALREADAIVYLVDATAGRVESLVDAAALSAPPRAPVVTVVNKCDAVTARVRATLSAASPDASFVSARTGEGVRALLARLRRLLPESPFLYPADDISTQHLRFFVAEMIREAAIEQLSDELPHSVACEIEEYREGASPVYIRASLHVERESQKRIVVGAGGERIKAIGILARRKMEGLIGAQVFLDLRVKVLVNWRKDPSALSRLGFQVDEGTTDSGATKDHAR